MASPVHAFTDDALGSDDACGIAQRIAGGEIQAAEAVGAAIERARSVNPTLNAVVFEAYDRALERARNDGAKGRFGGLPTFIKDTDAVEGMPLRMGSAAFPDTPSKKTSTFVRQLLSTGLTPLGKTSLPELGLTGTTEPLAFGPCRNPWNPDHSTGGSSGGSAAMVAAGVVPIAHANDGGGSIRIPAACCGLVGLKASRGRLVGADGAELLPVDIIVQGVVTRSVRDTAAFMAAAERFRPSPNLSPLGLVEHPGKKRLRIAMFTDGATGAASHPACIEAVEKAAALCEELGHRVEPIASPYDGHIVEDFFCFWGMSPWAMRFLGKRLFGPEFDYGRLDPWSMGLARDFRSKILRTPKVIWRLRRFAHTYARLFGRWDLLLTPTLASPPVELGHIAPEVDFDTAVERVMNYCAFTPAQNVSGGAAISLPLFRDEGGLPVGVHFAGPIGGDRTLLELAFELEEARPWPLISQAG